MTTNIRRLTSFIALGCLGFALVSPARAHSVWLEPLAGKIVARFGELDGKNEKSPGHLDELSAPLAVAVVTNTPNVIAAPKKADHFLLEDTSPTNAVCLETSYVVMSAPGKPGRKPNFYARWQPAGGGAGTPTLTLDLVPTGKAGEVQVFFRGKPLGGIKAILRTPDDKEAELTADRDGFLRFASKQSGRHHLSIARHRESLAGFHLGKAYDATSHNAALTWIQP